MPIPRLERPSWLNSRICGLLLLAVIVTAALQLPRRLFRETVYSTVVLDRNGELLGARIADDGQWRFPPSGKIPDKYEKALIQFEDRAFRWHDGVNVLAVGRAAVQNIRERRIVSGGSTITMQVIRLSRGGRRSLFNKAVEAVEAKLLELGCTKRGILSLYASHAPFGGNVVGIDAASWRYFGHEADELSWAEAATLAVLPNSPSSIHISRSREQLLAKRNRLLLRLFEKGYMDETDYGLALSEPLPDEPQPLPQYAPHLVDAYYASDRGRTVTTDIDIALQSRVMDIADRWNGQLRQTGVNDLAVLVMDVHSGRTLAYIGNANPGDKRPGAQVDIVRSPRSTGSILKPFLYSALLQEGELLPHTLLPDTPVNINGFSPQNFDLQFAGAVPASEALARSLNVPAVHMLRGYGVPRFHDFLRRAGMTTLTRDASVYGLSLILGGAEGTLGDITALYAKMAAWYQGEDWVTNTFPLYDRTAVYYTLDALTEVNRPDEMDWRMISSVHRIAWKTGTSYGFRDAWAVGVTPDYAVGVWAGNAQGQGSAGLVGARTAGPVLFDIFNLLPPSDWFAEPSEGGYIEAEVCRQSGQLAGVYCDSVDIVKLPLNALRSGPCPYHRAVTVSPDGRWRTDPSDPDAREINLFLLPPSMEWYYRSKHPEYVPLPPARPGTGYSGNHVPMEFIYPESGSVISIPRQLDGSVKGLVFNLAHTNPDTEVYWHLDDHYEGSTRFIHQLRLVPPSGRHTVTVVDSEGHSLSVAFTVE